MDDLNFKGKIVNSIIDSKKLKEGKKLRAVVIADLHGYTNDEESARRLAEAIKEQNPDYIFIAGDIFHGGAPWDGGEKLEKFRKFVDIISEVAPVFITWGNHDEWKMNPDNRDTRVGNLRALEDIRKGQVYPLFNDRVPVGDLEVVGFVPRFELMQGDNLEGLKQQSHGFAHDRFIEDYEATGAKFTNSRKVKVFLGHDPHLIAVAENGIGLGSLSKCDFFITGHLHDGYKPVLQAIGLGNIPSFRFDGGWVEMPGLVDKDGNKIKKPFWPPFYGRINLCRGIVYFDNNSQQKFWQSPDGQFYMNATNEVNKQIWVEIFEENARAEIIKNKLHSMIISEGVAPGFFPSEKMATINVVDINGVGRSR